ncbi:importin subunit beta-3 [Gonapodya prolifera JEL478]|uniref:Importin subunit beta-3 n=1 Tax=Gonapodya prolifera (strain JEL478) TaxID=1344416 RepID=A0A139AB11_GONPJ|nr:importin subunit beta-3 [Gonapodya prolifera JEL478]|eukprot:KXS13655.1 importin subunit beta-3 [Gonapodya prolifera JEL478]
MAHTFSLHALTPEAIAQLAALLVRISSSDANTRTPAENEFNQALLDGSQAPLVITGLANLCRTHSDPTYRSLACILLRRVAFKRAAYVQTTGSSEEEVSQWMAIGDDARSYTERQLLDSLAGESDIAVRRKVNDTISDLARHILEKGGVWPELQQVVAAATKSSEAGHRESGFKVLGTTPELMETEDPVMVRGLIESGLTDSDSHVRLAALHTAVEFYNNSTDDVRKHSSHLITRMLETLPIWYSAGDDDSLGTAFQSLLDLNSHFKGLRAVLPNLVEFCVTLCKNQDNSFETRQMAVELLTSVAEEEPAMVRKVANFAAGIVPVLLEWLQDLEEEEAWHTSDDNYYSEEPSADAAEEYLDRLSRSLGGKSVLPVTFAAIPALLSSNEWNKRHAGLIAISSIGEGCKKIMSQELQNILNLVLPHLRDPHPRVRYAACQAVGQMCNDFAPDLQSKYHAVILPQLIPTMDDTKNPRVQAHAAAALVNFAEEATEDDVAPYLDDVVVRLMGLLASPKKYVQEQALTTLATVADSAEKQFAKFYAQIMPLLLNALRQGVGKEYRLFRGKAMECASLIALAVGKDLFQAHAAEFCQLLVEIQNSITDSDDPQGQYLITTWARVCRVIGDDFTPYLAIVMPPLLKSASLKPDFTVLEGDEDPTEHFSEEDGWEFVKVQNQNIGVRTSVLEEKATAIEMLVCYARDLKGRFHHYVEQSLELSLPLLKFYFHEDIRHTAAVLLPHLIECVKDANYSGCSNHLADMWERISSKLIDSINTDPDPAFIATLYQSFHDCIEELNMKCLNPKMMEDFTTATRLKLEEYIERSTLREDQRNTDDHDDELEEALQGEEDEESDLLSDLSRTLHIIFKLHSSEFLPYFDALVPVIAKFDQSPDSANRQWALCTFDDMVQFTGPDSWEYHELVLPSFAKGLTDSDAEVQQAASYGIGVAAEFGGPAYAEMCAGALGPLFTLVNAKKSRDEENIMATENAVAAVAKICKFNNSKFDVNQVIPQWFATLPIVQEDTEAPLVYTYLMDLVDASHPGVADVPKLLRVFSEALAAEILEEGVANRMSNMLKMALGMCQRDVVEALWASLTVEQRTSLQKYGLA